MPRGIESHCWGHTRYPSLCRSLWTVLPEAMKIGGGEGVCVCGFNRVYDVITGLTIFCVLCKSINLSLLPQGPREDAMGV